MTLRHAKQQAMHIDVHLDLLCRASSLEEKSINPTAQLIFMAGAAAIGASTP